MSLITDTINAIDAKITGLDDDVEKADEKLRDQIIWIVAGAHSLLLPHCLQLTPTIRY